jgi:chromate transporter
MSMPGAPPEDSSAATSIVGVYHGTLGEVFFTFLKLGLTSFGGPVAHLGYFRNELVLRRKWIDEAGFADLVALCQFLPGPASSQVEFSLGVLRGGGVLGGIAAWCGSRSPRPSRWSCSGWRQQPSMGRSRTDCCTG